jgi:(1->4)-alpha-D-glucan 1-alpha-D-glucosylmutase
VPQEVTINSRSPQSPTIASRPADHVRNASHASPARPVPASTYRLQLQPGFGFADAGHIADYLASLGVSHVYLSPILQAAPGSAHGYDVVDHSRISADLGGEGAFRAMVARFRQHGLGVIADIVPNHMAIPAPESLNPQLWSVLREGTGSQFAHWFDVDWAAQGGRLLLPILAGPVLECLGDLTVDTRHGGVVLRYFDHVLPVRPGTEDLPLAQLLDAQHYRLASWRAAATELNYRRFFDVTTLIAIRVEDDDVFRATHALVLNLMADGLIDGLRVDHPDGLADPRGYLDRLAEATGGAWVVTEKILASGEQLPPDWRCAGTTGYDTLGVAGGLFLDPAGAGTMTREYVRVTGGVERFADVARPAKAQVARTLLAAEVSWLARLLAHARDPALRGLSGDDRRTVVAELLTELPVYRAYVRPGEPAPAASAAVVTDAAARASGRLAPRLRDALTAVCALVLGRAADGPDGEWQRELVVRFQQVCGPVMAKGVEDTAFYRWSRLVALNEVGGEPDTFGISQEQFGAFAGRLARDWPATLTTLSTHDTKRQEDVRARLAVLAEEPRAWADEVARWHARAVSLTGGPGPEPDTEYLLWQTLAGAWPIERDRATGYLTKAMHEAKTATSWSDPDPGYESAALGLAEAVLGDGDITAGIAGFVDRIAPDARVNSLGAKLVQLTMPGVADTYQGCELAGFALVDPDNRRLVDYGRRRELLAALDQGHPASGLDAEKLLVTSRALRLRRDHPEWFAGSFTLLRATGPATRHVVAFSRGGHAVTVATRLPARLRQEGGWRDTELPVPGGRWRDVLTGAVHTGERLLLYELTQRLPVVLLIPDPA